MDAMFKEDEHKVAAIFLRSKAIFAACLVGTCRVQGILAMYGFIMGSLRRNLSTYDQSTYISRIFLV